MRTPMRWGLVLGVVASSAAAQRPAYSPTLYWESGLIDIPAAWVAPLSGDVAISVARVGFDSVGGGATKRGAELSPTFALSLRGRAEVGVTVYSSALDATMFAKALLWDQLSGEYRRGVIHWIPSIAIGMRNIGPAKNLDRWAREGVLTAGRSSMSPYVVATRTLVLARDEAATPTVQFGATAGFGGGLFREDSDLGYDYSRNKTGGLFGGGKLDLRTGRFSTLSLMAESNAWDFNVGAQVESRGLRMAVSITELGAGAARPGRPYGYQKVNVAFGWQTNVLGLVRGNRLEERAAATERRTAALRKEIDASEARIATLRTRLRAVEGQSAAEAVREREALEAALREEMEALRRARERLAKPKPPEAGR
ncbi:MAG: hypothetical protein K2X99_02225 [Gemmatimonadaceae bacterium]|nr:hypothetical protein [Gemmatimonadaceae bacterium]